MHDPHRSGFCEAAVFASGDPVNPVWAACNAGFHTDSRSRSFKYALTFYIGAGLPCYMPWRNGEFVYTSELDDNKGQETTASSNNSQETKDLDTFDGDFEQPRANEVGVGITNTHVDIERTRDISGSEVFRRVKNSPEILSVTTAVVDDIIGHGVDYKYVGRTDNAENPGQRSLDDAKEFWRENKELISDWIIDSMLMGDGYLYKKMLDGEQAEQEIQSYIDENYSFNDARYKSAAKEAVFSKVNDRINETEEIELVPASTVEHDIDEFGNIERFVQEIGGEDYDLDPEKVVRAPYMNLNGKTYGFTPVATLFAELDMLANAKDYNSVKFDNAAVPNKIFKLPNDGPKSSNFQMVKETMEKYRQLKNKHRDLVMTGDIEIEDLSESDEMGFRELAEYVTRVIVMAWQVPPMRIGGVLGNQGATESAMAREGYNKRVQRMQDKYETVLNNELFEPMFSVRVSFNNPDVKSEIRQAERDLRQTEVVKQRMALGLMSLEDARDYIGVSNVDAPDVSEEEVRQNAVSMGSSQSGMMSDEEVSQSSAEEQVNQGMRPDNTGGNSEVENV